MNPKKKPSKKRQLKSLCKSSFVEDLYEHRKEVFDKRFGLISIWTKRLGEDLLLSKRKSSATLRQFGFEIEQAKFRLKMNHSYLLQMIDFSAKLSQSGQFELMSFYQAPFQDLKKEIRRRAQLNK